MIGTSAFPKACAAATQLALNPRKRLLPIPELRDQGIVPME